MAISIGIAFVSTGFLANAQSGKKNAWNTANKNAFLHLPDASIVKKSAPLFLWPNTEKRDVNWVNAKMNEAANSSVWKTGFQTAGTNSSPYNTLQTEPKQPVNNSVIYAAPVPSPGNIAEVSAVDESSLLAAYSEEENAELITVNHSGPNVLADPGTDCGCDYIVKPSRPTDDYIYVNLRNAGIKPGAKVCIPAGLYHHISISGLVGSEEKPITIVNCGGLVEMSSETTYGFRMVLSRYFRITGTGTPGLKYGFKITGIGDGTPPGLVMADSMTHFELDHFEVTHVSAGFYIKTSPKDCDPGSWEGAWEMRNMKIHDNYIHHSTGEGFYLGHTSYTAVVKDCSGASVTVGTQTMRNLKVYNNIMDYLGWDGIQLAGVVEGAEIYNNIVTNYGLENKSSQQGGILLGGKCNGKVYNNTVMEGSGNGLQVFGFGTNYVYNNLIVNAGFAGQDGVYIDDRPQAGLPGAKLVMTNNTIVRAGNIGIKLSNNYGTYIDGSILANNLIVAPGLAGQYSSAYIATYSASAATLQNNNYIALVSDAGFVSDPLFNYRLLSTSSSVDAGINTSSYGVVEDMVTAPRPSGSAYDVGSYEFIENNLLPPPPANANGDYATIDSCMPVAISGWTTFYDPDYNPVFELDRNGQSIDNLCWSNRIVTTTLRSNKGYYGNASIEIGAYFQRNYLLDKKTATAGSTTKLRLLITGDELNAFINAYNQAYGTACTAADVRVIQYSGINADLDFANNILSASLYKSITPTITSYGNANSLRGIEFAAVPHGEFWLALNRAPTTNIDKNYSTGSVGGSLGKSLKAWYRADKGTTISLTSVRVWSDLSGNLNDARQDLAQAQPSLNPASAAFNNQPALIFNKSSLDVGLDFNAVKTPYLTIFTVAVNNAMNHRSKIWGHDAGNYGRGAGVHESLSGGFELSYLTGASPTGYGIPTVAKGFISKNSYNPQSIVSSINGLSDAIETNMANVAGKTRFTIGNVTSVADVPKYNEDWDGQIAEMIVYNSLLSVAQEIIIENYLSAQYNLPISTGRNIYKMDDTTNGNYDFEVSGIGMANDLSAVLESSSLDMLTIRNANNLGSDEWLLIGNNGMPSSDSSQTLLPSGIQARLLKEWRVSEKGDVGTVDLEFDASSIPWVGAAGEIKLLIDVNNNGSFADETNTGGGVLTGEMLAANKVLFRNISLTTGQRLTLGFSAALALPQVYYFSGSGNFSDRNNWRNGMMPTDNIPGITEIIIDPAGTCILDIPFSLGPGMKMTIVPGKQMVVIK
ncbi:MAG TPA: right-handed parallel beta-helix repeat-containing protein [Phnomibacter sp.]|nr:right-handed parallel beta-helix repeat-containing protein [Phnomibacter sp.]